MLTSRLLVTVLMELGNYFIIILQTIVMYGNTFDAMQESNLLPCFTWLSITTLCADLIIAIKFCILIACKNVTKF